MTRRLPLLLIAFLAIPGLGGRHMLLVEHEHDGGCDPHQHAALVFFVGHSHSHDHDDDAQEGQQPSEDRSSDEEGTPEDGDRHGHYRGAQHSAVRRMTLGEDGAAQLANVPFSRVVFAPQQIGDKPLLNLPAPGDWRGCPHLRTARTIDRLVQGIGLLI